MTEKKEQFSVSSDVDEIITKFLDKTVGALLEKDVSHIDICAGLVSYGAAMSLELAPSSELAYTVILSSLLEQTRQRVAIEASEDTDELPGQNAPSTQVLQ